MTSTGLADDELLTTDQNSSDDSDAVNTDDEDSNGSQTLSGCSCHGQLADELIM